MSVLVASLGRQLSYKTIDSAARSARFYSKAGWSTSGAVTFDMEGMEYADFGATARFLTLAEGLVRHSWTVHILLPNPGLRDSEQEFVTSTLPRLPLTQQESIRRDLDRRVEARRRVRSFLRHVGFFRALLFEHLPPSSASYLTFSDRGTRLNPAQLATEARSTLVGGQSVRWYPAILPFRWLGPEDLHRARKWQDYAIRFLYDQGVVMTPSDAESLIMTVVSELVENVADHAPEADVANPPGALFGAITLNRDGKRYRAAPEHFYPSVSRYFEWLGDQRTPIARIIVADSGVGLTETVKPRLPKSDHSQQSPSDMNLGAIRYAFEPTVSRYAPGHRRGGGLTIVRRFVRSYGGFIAIRARNVNGGFEFSEGRPHSVGDAQLPYVPGTAIETLLGLTLRAREAREDRGVEDERAADIVPVIGSVEDDAAKLAATSMSALNDADVPLPVVLILVDTWNRERDSGPLFAVALARLATKLAGTAGIAVLLEAASDADCDSAFGAMDEFREGSDPSWRERWGIPSWCPPFLVVSATGRSRWSGGSTALRRLLYGMAEGASVDLRTLSEMPLSKVDLDYLSVERDWFRLDGRGGLQLRVHSSQIDNAVAADVATRLLAGIESTHARISF